jgi:cytochrome c oxidase subunit 2
MKMVKRVFAAGAAFLIGSTPAMAGWTDLNLRVGVTPLSHEIYQLHTLVLWICVAIAVAVFGVMIYSIATFRKSKGAVPATFDHSTTAEVIWTIIPVLILVGMAIPSARTLVHIDDASGSELTIKATGYQWMWQYEYVGTDVSFYSKLAEDSSFASQLHSGIDPYSVPNYLLDVDQPLVLPQGVKVRVLVTSADVIHSWWLPDFGIKKDAIPGYINEQWIRADKAGTYRGQCVELCGRGHGFMPIVVEVKPRAEFDAWLESRKAAAKAATPTSTKVAMTSDEPAAVHVAAAE